MILQPILNIVEICTQQGVNHVVISPGSRSAALTLAFARHSKITTKVIPDERVAGFIALGMAQQLREPVAVVCTSGSAAYNLAPAVAEAYFQEIPLLIFTADRPPEWIHQHDGQTMFQQNLYGKNIKKSFDLPADYGHSDALWHIERLTNEAINTARAYPQGPVHLNVPIREPFYPLADEIWKYDSNVKIVKSPTIKADLAAEDWEVLQKTIIKSSKTVVAVGQMPPNESLWAWLQVFSEKFDAPILGDIISNVPAKGNFIRHHDVFLDKKWENEHDDLKIDLLITIGNSFISKNLKAYLRKQPPKQHWHIKPWDELIDPFQSLTMTIKMQPEIFFETVTKSPIVSKKATKLNSWFVLEQKATDKLHSFFVNEKGWNEFSLMNKIMAALPEGIQLHLSNSMPVRYANLVGNLPKNTKVFANRGVSGIDGCTSTAVGAALITKALVFLITGDVAFFYDRNALWHKHLPNNLRIILFNNQGGNIFRLIDGPAAQPELEEFFETRHQTTAENTAKDADLEYFNAKNEDGFEQSWSIFCSNIGKSKIIEICTDPIANEKYFHFF